MWAFVFCQIHIWNCYWTYVFKLLNWLILILITNLFMRLGLPWCWWILRIICQVSLNVNVPNKLLFSTGLLCNRECFFSLIYTGGQPGADSYDGIRDHILFRNGIILNFSIKHIFQITLYFIIWDLWLNIFLSLYLCWLWIQLRAFIIYLVFGGSIEFIALVVVIDRDLVFAALCNMILHL